MFHRCKLDYFTGWDSADAKLLVCRTRRGSLDGIVTAVIHAYLHDTQYNWLLRHSSQTI